MRTFENEYGQLIVQPISDFMNVRDITHDLLTDECFFNMKTAEKIALITENKIMQIAFKPDLSAAYMIMHNTPHTAAACEIINLIFSKKVKPEKEIESLRTMESM